MEPLPTANDPKGALRVCAVACRSGIAERAGDALPRPLRRDGDRVLRLRPPWRARSRERAAAHRRQLAAESGLQFMRYQLGQVDITTGTLQADLLPRSAPSSAA